MGCGDRSLFAVCSAVVRAAKEHGPTNGRREEEEEAGRIDKAAEGSCCFIVVHRRPASFLPCNCSHRMAEREEEEEKEQREGGA